MKVDLHLHTTFSDGLSSPEEMVDSAIERGIKIICITDHNEIEGARRAIKYSFDKDILVVPGIEVSTKKGHILGINIKKKIKEWISPEAAVEEIKNQGGVAFLAHPFDWPMRNFRLSHKKIISLSNSKEVGLEVFNAGVIFGSSNKIAADFAEKNNLIFSAGSDAHHKDFVGRGYLEIKKEIKSENDLIKALKLKETEPKGIQLSWKELFFLAKKVHLDSKDVYGFFKNIIRKPKDKFKKFL